MKPRFAALPLLLAATAMPAFAQLQKGEQATAMTDAEAKAYLAQFALD